MECQQTVLTDLCYACKRYLAVKEIVAILNHQYQSRRHYFIIPRYFMLQRMVHQVQFVSIYHKNNSFTNKIISLN
jgi:hypothetical protein